jgi:hypothetical protein
MVSFAKKLCSTMVYKALLDISAAGSSSGKAGEAAAEFEPVAEE